jgi:hypothetical protein
MKRPSSEVPIGMTPANEPDDEPAQKRARSFKPDDKPANKPDDSEVDMASELSGSTDDDMPELIPVPRFVWPDRKGRGVSSQTTSRPTSQMTLRSTCPALGSMPASIMYRNNGGREEVQVHRSEYKCYDLMWHLYNRVEWCLGFDGSLLKGDEYVWNVAERKVMHLDYCTGTHELCFQSGEESVVPVFLTHCDEYVFGCDLVFLRAESNCDHTVFVGRVARALGGLVRRFRKRKHAEAAKRWQLEAARSRNAYLAWRAGVPPCRH